ncbi:hypothetical protein BBB43_14720 [Bordetella parapertussis]|nr:hypothetical protein BBB43_14720 [Bordetella parapertussis]
MVAADVFLAGIFLARAGLARDAVRAGARVPARRGNIVGARAALSGRAVLAGTALSGRPPRTGRRRGLVAARAAVELGAVTAGLAGVVALHVGGRRVALARGGHLARVGAPLDAARSAVVADAAPVDVLDDHPAFVDVGDARDVHIGDGAVVIEAVAVPVAAYVAEADVAIAVVDAAVKADVRTPIAAPPPVVAGIVGPVARRPQRARVGRQHPDAGHPVEPQGVERPIARHPDVAVARHGRLLVDRQGRRGLAGHFDGGQVGGGGVGAGGLVVGRFRVVADLCQGRWRTHAQGQGQGQGQGGERGFGSMHGNPPRAASINPDVRIRPSFRPWGSPA